MVIFIIHELGITVQTTHYATLVHDCLLGKTIIKDQPVDGMGS